jgi:hypothetical protein
MDTNRDSVATDGDIVTELEHALRLVRELDCVLLGPVPEAELDFWLELEHDVELEEHLAITPLRGR